MYGVFGRLLIVLGLMALRVSQPILCVIPIETQIVLNDNTVLLNPVFIQNVVLYDNKDYKFFYCYLFLIKVPLNQSSIITTISSYYITFLFYISDHKWTTKITWTARITKTMKRRSPTSKSP